MAASLAVANPKIRPPAPPVAIYRNAHDIESGRPRDRQRVVSGRRIFQRQAFRAVRGQHIDEKRDALGVPGLRGMGATLLYFVATQSGTLATVAILTSRYPGVTVVLARLILHELFSLAQRTGLGLAAIAVAAIAVN